MKFLALEIFNVAKDISPKTENESIHCNESSRSSLRNTFYFDLIIPKIMFVGLETFSHIGLII